MAEPVGDGAALTRRLERERRARHEAEEIAERTTRQLYETLQELRQSSQVLQLVSAVASAANESACLVDAVQACLDAVCQHTGWSIGHAYTADRDAPDELVSLGIWHVTPGFQGDAFIAASQETRFKRGLGLPGRVLDSGEPAWIEDVTVDPNFPRAASAGAAGLRTGFAFPVLIRSEVRAVLEFFSSTEQTLSTDLEQVMGNVGGQLGRLLEREEAEVALTYQAMHDSLTGLPNRALLIDRLEQAIARAERSGQPVEVLFLDLDDFKTVNDSLGHDAGDIVLSTVADRVSRCIRRSDSLSRGPRTTVARMGGDEFAIVLEDCGDAELVAQRIAAALADPVVINEQEVYLAASIGGAGVRPGDSADNVLRSADAAMYVAKGQGKSRYQRFDPSMHAAVRRRLQLSGELRRAVESDQLKLFFQPELRVEDGSCIGVEALLRWRHPTEGLVPPDSFIPLAEETGLIVPIGEWVLREACRQAVVWRDAGGRFADAVMSVNVSGRQLVEPNFPQLVEDVLRSSGLEPTKLCLEVTESVLVENVAKTAPVLRELHELGVLFAVDDFGTGYSSLASLQRFPVDLLKIDRSFVARIPSDEDAGTIVWAVIRLAHNLNLQVVAEGVETDEQLAALRGFGCDIAQGYLFSRPMPADELERA